MNFISLAFKSPGKSNSQRWRCPVSPVNHRRCCMAARLRKTRQIKNLTTSLSHKESCQMQGGSVGFSLKKKQRKTSLPGIYRLDNRLKETLIERQPPHSESTLLMLLQWSLLISHCCLPGWTKKEISFALKSFKLNLPQLWLLTGIRKNQIIIFALQILFCGTKLLETVWQLGRKAPRIISADPLPSPLQNPKQKIQSLFWIILNRKPQISFCSSLLLLIKAGLLVVEYLGSGGLKTTEFFFYRNLGKLLWNWLTTQTHLQEHRHFTLMQPFWHATINLWTKGPHLLFSLDLLSPTTPCCGSGLTSKISRPEGAALTVFPPSSLTSPTVPLLSFLL